MFRFQAIAQRVILRTTTTSRLVTPVAPRLFAVSTTSTTTTKSFSHRTLATLTEKEIQKRLDDFQELFVEARLSIEDATDSVGTTYYEEDAETAVEAVNEAVQAFEKLIEDIEDETEKNRILRGNGLKVEQLKGELEMALKGDDHHHH